MSIFFIFIIVFIILLLGSFLGFIAVGILRKQEISDLHNRFSDILNKAKIDIEEAKNTKLSAIDAECKKIRSDLDNELSSQFNNLKDLEAILNEREQKLEKSLDSVLGKQVVIDEIKVELETIKQQKVLELERLSGISIEEAKKQILCELENETSFNASLKFRKIINEAASSASREAKKILVSAIQRIPIEYTIENLSTIITLEDNTQKGIIIGKDGRNIRSLELSTGVDIIIDETPNAIVLSSFDPVRREIAKIAIQNLLQDGRVHPGRIEDVVFKVEASIEKEILNVGQHTVIDLEIYGMHEELIKLVGRMKYRTSYGQNLLNHSKEVARLATIIAAEIGLDVNKTKRAGLIHDIGKVSNANPELTHAILGMQLAEQYGEHPDVCNAIGAHHDEIEMLAIISPIIQICDSISGARPGARRDVTHQYLKRVHDMEKIALSYEGVKNCYAIQSGKELRIIVDAEKVSDDRSTEIAFDVARQIERDLQYPGQVKVTVIRERRAIDFAK